MLDTDVEAFFSQLFTRQIAYITLVGRYWHNTKATHAKLAFIITENVHKLLVLWQNIDGDVTYRVPKEIIGECPRPHGFGAYGCKMSNETHTNTVLISELLMLYTSNTQQLLLLPILLLSFQSLSISKLNFVIIFSALFIHSSLLLIVWLTTNI